MKKTTAINMANRYFERNAVSNEPSAPNDDKSDSTATYQLETHLKLKILEEGPEKLQYKHLPSAILTEYDGKGEKEGLFLVSTLFCVDKMKPDKKEKGVFFGHWSKSVELRVKFESYHNDDWNYKYEKIVNMSGWKFFCMLHISAELCTKGKRIDSDITDLVNQYRIRTGRLINVEKKQAIIL